MIYVGKTYTSTVTGSRIVPVHCEKCSADYVYELVRQAKGSAIAPYFIGTNSGPGRAKRQATKILAKKLAREQELVPCPTCGWINESLVAGYRRMRYGWLVLVGFILAIAVGATLLLVLTTDRHFHADEDLGGALITTAITMSVFAGVPFLIRWALRSQIRPNRKFPSWPALPEGTPRGRLTADVVAGLRPVDDRYSPGDATKTAFPDWVVFNAGQLVFPEGICCECLAPATTRLRQRVHVYRQADRLQPPACAACASRLRASWWAWFGGGLVAVGVVATGTYFVVRGDQVGRMMASVFAGVAIAAVALIIAPNRAVQTYKLRRVDRDRAIWRIRFNSEQYTELVRKNRDRQEVAAFIAPVMTMPPRPKP